MGLFSFSMRKFYLLDKKSDLEFQKQEANQKINDALSYITAISDGNICINDIVSIPEEWRGRLNGYMRCSQSYASDMATQDLVNMSNIFALQQQQNNYNAQQMQTLRNMAFNERYEKRAEEIRKNEERRMHVIEKNLQNQLAKIEMEQKTVDKELDSINSAMDKSIQEFIPKYA